MLQISVRELYNNIILPVSQGVFYVPINEGGRVCIGDNLLIKYTPNHINPMNKIYKITCGCETYISAMLLHYGLNKWQFKILFAWKVVSQCRTNHYFKNTKGILWWIQESNISKQFTH